MTTTGAPEESTKAAEESAGLLALLADPSVGLASIPMPRIGGEPPAEFRAFKWGDNPTTKGTLKLTPEGAQQIMDNYRKRGHVLCFDYFHATYSPVAVGEDKKAAGQTEPEIRGKPGDEDGGLYFARIQWTPKAAQGIRDGEWPFISPAVIHDKSGVMFDLKNPGLVTDPGTIGARPLVLSGSEPPERTTSMSSDNKRQVTAMYAALEGGFRLCQALAGTDGADKDLGNQLVDLMAPVMDRARGHMQSSGYLAEGMLAARQHAAGQQLMAQLSTDFNETDLEKLHGKLVARLDAPAAPAPLPEGSLLLSQEDQGAISKLLLSGHANRIPTAKRGAVEAMPLTGQVAYLSAAPDITPPAVAPTPREAPPLPPTKESLKEAMSNTTTPPPSGSQAKTYAQLDADDRRKVDEVVEAERKLTGANFNEQAARESAMTLLSDYEPPTDAISRHMPPGGAAEKGLA